MINKLKLKKGEIMKTLLSLLAICAICTLTSCGMFNKSEEAIKLTIDTASILKGRSVDAQVKIDNSDKAEVAR